MSTAAAITIAAAPRIMTNTRKASASLRNGLRG
jgi:hypothetical protein